MPCSIPSGKRCGPGSPWSPPNEVTIVAAELGSTAGAIGAALAAVKSPTKDQRFLAGDFPSARIRRAAPEATDGRCKTGQKRGSFLNHCPFR